MASLIPAHTSSGRNTSSSRSTWTNSRLPRLAMRASIRRRSVAQVPPDQWRRLVESGDLAFEQSQVMQRVEDEVLALVGAQMAGDHLGSTRDHHLVDIAADHHLTVAIGGPPPAGGAPLTHHPPPAYPDPPPPLRFLRTLRPPRPSRHHPPPA